MEKGELLRISKQFYSKEDIEKLEKAIEKFKSSEDVKKDNTDEQNSPYGSVNSACRRDSTSVGCAL